MTLSQKHLSSHDQTLEETSITSLKHLLCVCFPLMLTLVSASLMGFCDRAFLSNYSLESLLACSCASSICMLLQIPCMRLAQIGQVFVGRLKGSKDDALIGTYVWQMVWLSIISMLVTTPIGLVFLKFYFEKGIVGDLAQNYLRILIFANFLFSLGSALSSFFIGLGKTKIVLYGALLSQLFNFILDYAFIFGIKGLLAPQGIKGAAYATAIAQAAFCLFLFIFFMSPKNRALFKTGEYGLKKGPMLACLKISLPRALASLNVLAGWAAITHVVMAKGGDYLTVLSIGSAICILFSFITDALSQGVTSIASNLIGSNRPSLIKPLIKTGIVFLSITACFLSVVLVFFPHSFLSITFFGGTLLEMPSFLRFCLLFLWLNFICLGINRLGSALLNANGHTLFLMLIDVAAWVLSFVPISIGLGLYSWPPETLWLIMALDSLLTALVYFWYVSKRGAKPLGF